MNDIIIFTMYLMNSAFTVPSTDPIAPANAPAGGLYGNSAPAPSAGLFGASAPAPPSSFAAPAAPQQQQQYAAPLSGNTPYSQLPSHVKHAIDDIYRQITTHRRTLASIASMAPSLLEPDHDSNDSEQPPTAADIAAGSPRKIDTKQSSNLARQLSILRREIEEIAARSDDNLQSSNRVKAAAGEAAAATKLHGMWPVEAVAARRRVVLSGLRRRVEDGAASSNNHNNNNNSDNKGNELSRRNDPLSTMPEMDALALRHVTDVRAASVDRREQIPSPYYWEMMRDLETRARGLCVGMEGVASRLEEGTRSGGGGGGGVGECGPYAVLCREGHESFPARCAKLARIQVRERE